MKTNQSSIKNFHQLRYIACYYYLTHFYLILSYFREQMM